MTDSPPLPQTHLPLKPIVFQILLILSEGERHGWSIVKELEARSNHGKRILPGNLYRTLKRMTDDGLIEESVVRPDPAGDDERRRYFRVTDLGVSVARAEMDRLEQLLTLARSTDLAVSGGMDLRTGEAGSP